MGRRGRGLGRGGGRQGLGPNPTCRCPKCGASYPHTPGVPCMQQICPKCNVKLVGV